MDAVKYDNGKPESYHGSISKWTEIKSFKTDKNPYLKQAEKRIKILNDALMQQASLKYNSIIDNEGSSEFRLQQQISAWESFLKNYPSFPENTKIKQHLKDLKKVWLSIKSYANDFKSYLDKYEKEKVLLKKVLISKKIKLDKKKEMAEIFAFKSLPFLGD